MSLAVLHERASAPLWDQGSSALQLLIVAGFFVFLIESSLGGAGRLGEPIGRVSDSLATTITPAGWAFSIWSAIFVLNAALAVYQSLPSRRLWSASRLGWWYAANTVIGEGIWTLSWVGRWGSMWVSALTLVFIVATLAGLYLRIDAGVAPLSPSPAASSPTCGALSFLRKARPARTLATHVLLEGSVSLYMGWTTAATILNVSIALVATGVSPSGPAAAAAGVIMLLTASALAVAAAVTRTDVLFAAALAWALAGIRSNQLNDKWPVREPTVLNAAGVACGIAATAAVCALLARIRLVASGELRLAAAGSDANEAVAEEGEGGAHIGEAYAAVAEPKA